MGHETSPLPIINPDGSLNEVVLNEQYGLGPEEAEQEVTFGRYKGTVAEMLNDARCPVGERIRTAYQEMGLDGVVGQFEALRTIDQNFRVNVKKK